MAGKIFLFGIHYDKLREGLTDAIQRLAPATEVIVQHEFRTNRSSFSSGFSPDDTLVVRYNHRPPHGQSREALQSFFEREEWANMVYGLGHFLDDGQFYNHPARVRVANSKPAQLEVAARLGLRTPRSLITNVRDHAAEFVSGLGATAIVKPIDCSIAPNPDNAADTLLLYTQEIREEQLLAVEPEKFARSPVILQEKIDKAHELRVVVNLDEGVAVAIDSQKHPHSSTDWRRRQSDQSMFSYADLDDELLRKLSRYLAVFGLQSGAFDLAVTPEGESVFFECNPNGQWSWFDFPLGGRILHSMARGIVAFAGAGTRQGVDDEGDPIERLAPSRADELVH